MQRLTMEELENLTPASYQSETVQRLILMAKEFLAMDKELTAERQKVERLRNALLLADRYFDAKNGLNQCDVDLCEKTARYGVDAALRETEDGGKE